MANISDYVSGKIISDVKKALFLIKWINIPFIGAKIKKLLTRHIKPFEPILTNHSAVSEMINNSSKQAVGERVCRTLFKDSPLTESVFLDELAIAMVAAGKAQFSSKNEAKNTLLKYTRQPIIISKISGKYMEICCSMPQDCIYWNMEKRGIKCLKNSYFQK